MQCQSPECNKKAVWRIIDRCTLTGQKTLYGPFFYYYCDGCKRVSESLKTIGHTKEYQKMK